METIPIMLIILLLLLLATCLLAAFKSSTRWRLFARLKYLLLYLLWLLAISGLHGCDWVMHGEVLVLWRRALILWTRLDSVSILILICTNLLYILGWATRILHIHDKSVGSKLLIWLICQLIDQLRSVFVGCSKVGIQVKIVLSFVENDGLTWVKSQHICLTYIEAVWINDLGSVCNSSTHGGAIACLRPFAMSAMVSIGKRRSCSAFLSELLLLTFLILIIFLIVCSRLLQASNVLTNV